MTIKSAYRLVYHQGHPELESLFNNIVNQSIVNYHPVSEFEIATISPNFSPNIFIPQGEINFDNIISNAFICFLRILNPLPNSAFEIHLGVSEIEWVYYPYGYSNTKHVLINSDGSIFWEGEWNPSDSSFSFNVEYLFYYKNSSSVITKREELVQIKLFENEGEIKGKLNINNLRPLEDIEIISCYNIDELKSEVNESIFIGDNNLKIEIIKNTGEIKINTFPSSLVSNPTIATLLLKIQRETYENRNSFFDFPFPSETPSQNTIFVENNLEFLNQEETTINYNNIKIPENIEYLYFLFNGIGTLKITIKSKIEENEKIKTFYNKHGQLVLVGKNGIDFGDYVDLSVTGKGAILKDFVLWGIYNVE